MQHFSSSPSLFNSPRFLQAPIYPSFTMYLSNCLPKTTHLPTKELGWLFKCFNLYICTKWVDPSKFQPLEIWALEPTPSSGPRRHRVLSNGSDPRGRGWYGVIWLSKGVTTKGKRDTLLGSRAYPHPRHLWRWFSFSQGGKGIYSSLEGRKKTQQKRWFLWWWWWW